MVLIMSVNPGFGGQSFIDQSINKIRQLKRMITEAGSNTLIEVDGGVTLDNAHALMKCGADVLVAGNTVFAAASPADMISNLKSIVK